METNEREKLIFGNIPSELKVHGEIESYDNILDQHPKYRTWYNICLALESLEIKNRLNS